MHQRLGAVTILLVCLGSSWAKDAKPLRSIPAISNSLVNLGKMDISFHFSSPNKAEYGQPNIKSEYIHSASPFFLPKSEPQIELENCPCSTIKNFKNPFLNNPAEFVNKILRSNDLFSANQEPLLSSMCCDSHEHDETVFFELTPKNNFDSSASIASLANPIQQVLPSFPMILDSILPKAPISNTLGGKQKAIEIFFFPKSKDGKLDFTKMSSTIKDVKPKKNEIQIVGDKDLRNDFKNYKYRPTFPILQKKDTRLDNEKKIEKARQDLKEIQSELKEMQEKKKEMKLKDENKAESTTPTASTVSTHNVL